MDTIYSCCPENSSPQYEVHVLAVYEAGIVTVNIISGGTSNRPVVLVLVNYEAVKWILIIPFDIIIGKVILVSTTITCCMSLDLLLQRSCHVFAKPFIGCLKNLENNNVAMATARGSLVSVNFEVIRCA